MESLSFFNSFHYPNQTELTMKTYKYRVYRGQVILKSQADNPPLKKNIPYKLEVRTSTDVEITYTCFGNMYNGYFAFGETRDEAFKTLRGFMHKRPDLGPKCPWS